MPECLEHTIQEKTKDHIEDRLPILPPFPGIISRKPGKKHPSGEYHPSNEELV
jgi:hypothetical protein